MKHDKKHLILENAFDSNIKLYIYIFFLFPLGLSLVGVIESTGWIQVLAIFAFIVILFAGISVWIIKKGLVKNKKGIHIGYFTWEKLLFLEPIGILGKSSVSILKFKRRGRAAFTSIANSDFSEAFNTFEIYLLNEKHTVKEKVLTLKTQEKADSAISFMTEQSRLVFELYSPDFS